MKKTSTSAATAAPERVSVDYPCEGETVASPRCTFLIDAPERRVEIAIDGEGWRSCRRRDDRWWFEWSCGEPGRHQAIVRSEGPAGAEPTYRVCRFMVEPSAAARRTEWRGESHGR